MARKVDGTGRSVRVTVPQNTVIEQGEFVLLDGFFGMAVQAVTTGAGETKPLILEISQAEFETKQIVTTDTFAVGGKVYFDSTAKKLTTTATSNLYVGRCLYADNTNDVISLLLAPVQA